MELQTKGREVVMRKSLAGTLTFSCCSAIWILR